MDHDEARAALEAVEELLHDREMVSIIYPANHRALGLHPRGLLLSAAPGSECEGCGKPFNVGGTIEGYYDNDGVLWVEAEFSRQHGCGFHPEIVQVDWDASTPFDPQALVRELRDLVAAARARRDADTRDRLRRELAEFLARPEADRTPGDNYEPGISRGDRGWEAWDYSATHPGDFDVIIVSEADLAAG